MDNFYDRPILNSPYEYPSLHWELDKDGQPTNVLKTARRRAEFITPIPKAKRRRKTASQEELAYGDETGVATEHQKYAAIPIINDLRGRVEAWRSLPSPNQWHVTPETARLLQHWRHHKFSSIRPFFCQVEAVETMIWLTEVAPQLGKDATRFLEHLKASNDEANSGLARLALKLATGAS